MIVVLLTATIAGFVLSFGDQLEEPELGVEEEGTGNPLGEDELFSPKNPVAGAEDVEYRLLFEVNSDDGISEGSEELSNIDVVVNTGDDMFTGVVAGDLESFEINGEEQDVDATDLTWDSDSGGAELNIELDGVEYDPEEGDEVALVFGGVDNPESPGTYDIDVELNGDDEKDGELEIVEEAVETLARRVS